MKKPDSEQLYEQPFEVHVVDRAVVILGPDGVALAITPEAAEKSADLLRRAAGVARRNPPGRGD